MTQYTANDSAILLVDPYNDFMSEGGKLFDRTSAVAKSVGMVEHIKAILQSARAAGITIFYVPHRRWRSGALQGWKHISPYVAGSLEMRIFADGEWGGDWHPEMQPQDKDVIIKEHLISSGFANTDLDFQLKQRELSKLVLIGMIANTCLESTGKFGVELGYHVTLVRDATSAFTPEAMRVAHEINGPTYAHEILDTAELLRRLA